MTDTGPILVTGGSGQLATSLYNLGGDHIIRVGRPEFDFDRPDTITDLVEKYQPSAVVNAAAWTAVDLAEQEQEQVTRANSSGPEFLAQICAKICIPLIHISTDYVFSGDKGSPYKEDDATSPQTVYGKTKTDGEQLVLNANSKSIILRTSWVYSQHGKNFVKTIINAGAKNNTLKVVGDQKGNPTSSDDLALAILAILKQIKQNGWKNSYSGIYHASGSGEATWHSLATKALKEAENCGQVMPSVVAILTEDWPTPAKRPRDSRLDCSKLEEVFNIRFPDWQDSLVQTVRNIFAKD